MLAHFATIAVYVAFSGRQESFADTVQGIASVAPVAAIYVATFIAYVSNNPLPALDEKGPGMTLGAFVVQGIVIVLFCLALIGLPWSIFSAGWTKVSEAALYTGAIDTVFSLYLTSIFQRLFPLEWKK